MIDFYRIDELKDQLDRKRPLPPAAVKNLREVYRVEWTYHSTAIEGNTLNLLEIKLVLEEGLTIGGKYLREHLEVVNHGEAIDYIENIVQNEIELTENVIKEIHYLILKNIDNENAGKYRSVNVRISGSEYQPPHLLQVQTEMGQLIEWFHLQKVTLHPVELASMFHFKFVYIHPFSDGNGRTARLLMNLILMKNGFPPAIIKSEPDKRMKYYETLEQASVRGDVQPFMRLVADCVEESLNRYLGAVV